MNGLDLMQLTFKIFSQKSHNENGNFHNISSLGTHVTNPCASNIKARGNFLRNSRLKLLHFDNKKNIIQ